MQQAKDSQPQNFVGMNGQTTGLGFTSRDTEAKKQQQKNIITFKVIKNDQTRESMRYLLDLKNIFARQLPKMPKQYIVKLVFDRNHQSMVILKDNSKVIGGICFRLFQPEKFVEIAFLAITSTEQIRGYGTRLMNKLKEEMQSRKIQFMMTYADNLALGYFRKQGFSKDCRSPPDRWKGYIKDYEGGTMMQCFIHPTIDYSRVSQIIKKQREHVISKVKELSLNDRVYNGKDLQKLIDREKQLTRTSPEGVVETFRIDPEKIPGVIEGGWKWEDHDELKKTKEISFQLQCSTIIDLLKKHQSVWPFREAVSLEDVPDYYTVVKNPIDLKKIENKLLNNDYPDRETFCIDVNLMFENCKSYNQHETIYHKCAVELSEYIQPHLQKLKEGNQEIMGDVGERTTRKMAPVKKKIEKKNKH